jgi:hypothetical protein
MSELDFDAAYKVEGYDGIAWRIKEFAPAELNDDEVDDYHFCHPSEMPVDESRVIAIMIGDDRQFEFGIDEITPIEEDSYCHSCGQIGCNHG